MSGIYLYFAPLTPIIIRLVVSIRYRRFLRAALNAEEADVESHRAVVVALAGFSFTGLIGLIVVDAATRTSYKFAIYFLLTSFLCYLFTLNLQGYKLWRWIDVLSDAVWESASLSLILAIVQTMRASRMDSYFIAGAAALAGFVWGIDFIVRVVLFYRYLSKKIGGQNVGRQKEPATAARKARPK